MCKAKQGDIRASLLILIVSFFLLRSSSGLEGGKLGHDRLHLLLVGVKLHQRLLELVLLRLEGLLSLANLLDLLFERKKERKNE